MRTVRSGHRRALAATSSSTCAGSAGTPAKPKTRKVSFGILAASQNACASIGGNRRVVMEPRLGRGSARAVPDELDDEPRDLLWPVQLQEVPGAFDDLGSTARGQRGLHPTRVVSAGA